MRRRHVVGEPVLQVGRNSATSGAPPLAADDVPTSRLWPGASSRTTTTQSRTARAVAARTLSRPARCGSPAPSPDCPPAPGTDAPSRKYRDRSPVRYIRAPGSAAYGSGMNFSAVSSGRSGSRAPAPHPQIEVAVTPTGTGRSTRRGLGRRVGDRPPDVGAPARPARPSRRRVVVSSVGP